jgi:hypothetical protein
MLITFKHGEERNRCTDEIDSGLHAHVYTVTERWCENCEGWIESRGLILNILCHQCKTNWKRGTNHEQSRPRIKWNEAQ